MGGKGLSLSLVQTIYNKFGVETFITIVSTQLDGIKVVILPHTAVLPIGSTRIKGTWKPARACSGESERVSPTTFITTSASSATSIQRPTQMPSADSWTKPSMPSSFRGEEIPILQGQNRCKRRFCIGWDIFALAESCHTTQSAYLRIFDIDNRR